MQFRSDERVRVVVCTEGPGGDWLAEAKAREGLDNLLLLPFQPFPAMPDVLGSADVLVAILEPDAGVFSVPSKVLTYLCAARPLLLAMPPENLAARIVTREQAGLVVAPDQPDAFLQAAQRLRDEEVLREEAGAHARSYALRTFPIATTSSIFLNILSKL